MSTTTVGIRELKARLSYYLQRDRTHCLLLTADTSLESWITTHLKAYSDLCLAEDRL
jgi:hypothetical protein